MRHVVITGGTRGIGRGLVNEFLGRGFQVSFCGSNDRTVRLANDHFSEKWPDKKFKGVVCDVSREDHLVNLWDFATKVFGKIDIWINNAGISNEQGSFNSISPVIYRKIIDVNIRGMMDACHLAYNRMKKQGGGFIYNMGGLGSDGRMIKGLTPYGMSKRAVQYFTKSFSAEVGKDDNIKIGLLLPGMVLTDMLLEPLRRDRSESNRSRKVFNLLAEEVEPVASYLTGKIIENDKNGLTISYTSSLRMFLKVPGRLISGRDIVSKYI